MWGSTGYASRWELYYNQNILDVQVIIDIKIIKFSRKGDSESALVRTVETNTNAMVKLTYVLTKVMRYWFVAGIGYSAKCPSTDIILRVHWLGGTCVMYCWKYGQRSIVIIPMGIHSNMTTNKSKYLSKWK